MFVPAPQRPIKAIVEAEVIAVFFKVSNVIGSYV